MIDKEIIKYLRHNSLKTLYPAGHLGTVTSVAPILYCLYFYVLNIHTDKLNWINKDRFVLSNGWGFS